MKKKNNILVNLDKVLTILIAGCFAFILFLIVWGSIVSPDLGLFQEMADVYDNEWTMENVYGNTESFTMPTNLDIEDGATCVICTTLPDNVENGTYLAITTGKNYKAYVDGEEIYSFDNTISKIPGHITKPVVVPIPLKESYSGKELSLVLTNGKYNRSMIHTAYIGTMMGIVSRLLKDSSLQFVMAILLVIAALVTIAIFLYIEIREKRRAPLVYLAQGIMLISLWIIFNSHLFQLVFGKYFYDGFVGYMLVITMALPFAIYFDAILEGRYHMVFVVCEALSVINFVALTVLHMTKILDYYAVLTYIDGILLVYILLIIICIAKDYLTRKNKEHRNVLFGLVGLGIFTFLEVVVTILNARVSLSVDISGLSIIGGMVILLFFATMDQIKVFEDIRQETQNAIAATKAKSDFLANMSHEIRTPINAIMGMNEMILRESTEDAVKDYAKDVNSASENLLKIVNDILDFSKIESGKLEIINDNYDLGEIIYDVTTLVNMKAESKGIKLNVYVDENMPSKLYGDDKRVREVITNILNNAVKYTDTGFVNLKIGGMTNDNIVSINICVEDSGQGIKAEDIDKIFSGFSQVNTKKNKNVEGTGLGLSITKRLVELMEGTIKVESEFGKGSIFTVVLPQRVVSEEKMGNYLLHRHVSANVPSSEEKQMEFPGAKILVVDDTAVNLKIISKFLGKSKAETVCLSSGEEMLKAVQENRYDLILLDHMMPNMDGIEALKAAKELPNNKCMDVPVIALTANAIVGAKEMYIEAGFDDYLSKPVKMDTLYDMIRKYLEA